jgi:hypothetical protein
MPSNQQLTLFRLMHGIVMSVMSYFSLVFNELADFYFCWYEHHASRSHVTFVLL